MHLATQVEPYRSWKQEDKKKKWERIIKSDESLQSRPEWAGRIKTSLRHFCE